MKNFYQRISNFVESKYKLIFVFLLIFAFIFNLYNIDKVPNGVNLDEAGLGVDVYSIANYGTDRNMNKFPVYFQNFGEGQSALYIYLAAILVKMFGFSVFINGSIALGQYFSMQSTIFFRRSSLLSTFSIAIGP